MIGEARQFIDRVRAGLQSSVDMSHMADWICANTTHPKRAGKKWSFAQHEMQIAIANDSRPYVAVRKCSQVGLSELAVRICLALLSTYQGYTAIYTLPTAAYARKFTKARFDPVIDASEYLSGRLNSDNDSSELKQIGTSFLYIQGTSGQSAAISIPADILFRDEIDFSNQVILSQYFSRLGHAGEDGQGGIIRDWSTPSVNGFGISAGMEESSKGRYTVKCPSCSQKVAPDPLVDIVIPGFNDKLINFDKLGLSDPRIRIHEAYLQCPSCKRPIPQAALCDPTQREWVHAYPDRDKGGYQIMPFDVPTINPIPKTIRAIENYSRKADWVNFELGQAYEDAENSFVRAVVKAHSILQLLKPAMLAATNCVAGLDIGKVSHLLIGHRNGMSLDIIWREEIRQDSEDNLVTTVMTRIKQFGIIKLVVDANPDFTTAMKLIGKNPIGRVFGCYYVRSNNTAFQNYDVKEEESIINANRTRCFDATVKKANSGKYNYPSGTDDHTMMSHMANIKRIQKTDMNGDVQGYWVSTGEDHYAHALNYLEIADSLCSYIPKNAPTPSLPCMSRVKFGGLHEPPPVEKLLG